MARLEIVIDHEHEHLSPEKVLEAARLNLKILREVAKSIRAEKGETGKIVKCPWRIDIFNTFHQTIIVFRDDGEKSPALVSANTGEALVAYMREKLGIGPELPQHKQSSD